MLLISPRLFYCLPHPFPDFDKAMALDVWFSQDQKRTAKGATIKEQRAGEREEKARILANFACFVLKKMTKHRFTMDFEKAIQLLWGIKTG